MRWRWTCAAVCVWATACAGQACAAVRVVATIFPLADIVRQIGRDDVEVVTLLPPGASPHTFEPTPAQIRQVAGARVFVEVGAGLDSWTARLRAAPQEEMTVVTVTAGVPLLGARDGQGGDPHIWLDPVLVRDRVVPAIAAALSHAEPSRRAAFEQAAAEYQSALTRLDAEIRAGLAPVVNRDFIAFHSAWRYFAQRYGLREMATVEAFPGKEPSAQEIARVIENARTAHVRVLLAEPQFNPRTAEQIAREFDGRTMLVDPIGGAPVAGRDHYVDLMRYNLGVFIEALR